MTQNSSVESYNPSIMERFPPSKKTPTLYISGPGSQTPLPAFSVSNQNGFQLDSKDWQKYSPSLESKPYFSRIFRVHDPYPVQPLDIDAEETQDDFIDDALANFEPIVPGVRYEYVPAPLAIRVEFVDPQPFVDPEPVSSVIGGEETPLISGHFRSVFEPENAGPQNYYDTFKGSTVKPYVWNSNAQPYYSIARKRADVTWVGTKVGADVIAGGELSTNKVDPAFDFNRGWK